jgi:anti-sigma factor RsiW
MDDCQRSRERLTPYVDDALPPGERGDVERHLDRCPPCRRSAVEEQGGRTLLRERADSLRQSPLPPGLRSRCEALAREHCGRGRTRPWLTRVVSATLAATLVAVTAWGVLSLATRRSSALLAAQLTADHAKCFRFFGTSDSADAEQVERSLEAEYGWAMHVPPSSPERGLRLVGGRRCLYAEGTMPHVMYSAAGASPVSLFRLEGVSRGETDVTTMGYRCRIWSRDGNTYALVTAASSSSDDAGVVRYMRREAR